MTATQEPTLVLRRDTVAFLRDYHDLKEDKALAVAMGVSPSTVSRVLNGKSDPGVYFLAALCHALNAPIEKIAALDPPLPVSTLNKTRAA